jgi:hypothetical protein
MPEQFPSQNDLEAMCREWQERLKLRDWRVRIRYSEKFELDGHQGRCITQRSLKTALIRINPFCERGDPDDPWGPLEEIIIHELLHLHFDWMWDFPDGSMQHQLAEQTIENVTWALYLAKYPDRRDEFVVVTNEPR